MLFDSPNFYNIMSEFIELPQSERIEKHGHLSIESCLVLGIQIELDANLSSRFFLIYFLPSTVEFVRKMLGL